MQDKYVLTYSEALEAIQSAAGFCSCILLINGEYYDIKPDTVPKKETYDFITDLLNGDAENA